MKKKSFNRLRSTRRRKSFSFEALEARQLLAGDLAGAHQVSSTLPTDANVVVNGDFESFVTGADNFYADSEVDGWQTIGDNTELNIFEYQGWGHVLDLDSTVAEFDRVYQNVPTEANAEYLVTFDFIRHPGDNPGATEQSYDFEVWWNNELITTYKPTDFWQTGTIRVTSSQDVATVLLFCEIREQGQPDGGDGMGALLDNIRVMKASQMDLVDASFESAAADGLFYKPFQIEGWNAMNSDFAQRWLKIPTSDDSISATDGNRYLNLDATPTNRDAAYRDLSTIPGSTYYVTFDMRIDGPQDTDSDELRVRWNENWAATLQGNYQWQNYGLMLTADSASTRLTFLEPGQGDGSGPLIDNVRVYAVESNSIFIDADANTDGITASATYVPGAGAIAITPSLELAHASDQRITSATITLNGVLNGSSERLAISEANLPTDGSGNPTITLFDYRPETRQLQLVGEATIAEYQNVLRSLAYFNDTTNVGTTDRTVTVEVSNNNLPLATSTSQAEVTIAMETDQRVIDDTILQKFIADNSLNATAVEGSNGLYAVIDTPGTGLNPTINSTVRVAYTGRFLTLNSQNQIVEGDTFDASDSEGISFPLTNVITGWQLGIPQFKTGGSGKLLIPSHLAYGSTGTAGIPGNSVLVFDVELKQIVS